MSSNKKEVSEEDAKKQELARKEEEQFEKDSAKPFRKITKPISDKWTAEKASIDYEISEDGRSIKCFGYGMAQGEVEWKQQDNTNRMVKSTKKVIYFDEEKKKPIDDTVHVFRCKVQTKTPKQTYIGLTSVQDSFIYPDSKDSVKLFMEGDVIVNDSKVEYVGKDKNSTNKEGDIVYNPFTYVTKRDLLDFSDDKWVEFKIEWGLGCGFTVTVGGESQLNAFVDLVDPRQEQWYLDELAAGRYFFTCGSGYDNEGCAFEMLPCTDEDLKKAEDEKAAAEAEGEKKEEEKE